MAEVSLKQILISRDERVKKQQDILKQYKYPIISFTMNIAGPVKTSPAIERAFFEGVRLLEESFKKSGIVYQEVNIKETGCEAIFSICDNATKIKDICVGIEDTKYIGRLFDMDVIDTDGCKLERKTLRSCIVCNSPGRNCAVSRAHSVEKLQEVTNELIENYFLEFDAERCSALAVKSLLDEVHTTPKPGLVDCRNNGSHKDMDVGLFEKSANALRTYFGKCFLAGKETKSLTFDEAFVPLRNLGITAERTMYNATGGINTHKGAVCSFGILCAAIGRLWTTEKPFADIQNICHESSNLSSNAIKKDFEQINTSTAGGRLYLKYGLKGIRGEVNSGFSSVLNIALPTYTKFLSNGFDHNYSGAVTLLHLMANVKDTNVFHRGGIEGARYVAETVSKLLRDYPQPTLKQIEVLDDCFINRNLSPGGCADLLAITYFLYNLNNHYHD